MLHDRSVLVEDCIHPVCSGTKDIRIVEGGNLACIQAAFVHHDSILCSIQDSGLAPWVLEAIGEIIADFCLAFLAFLCGDEDNAVCSTCAVDSTGSSILEDLDTLNIVGVQVVDTTGRHAIDNVQGL